MSAGRSGSRVLALILAGGEGSRLDVLTEERAKPAVPFGGVYRLIDFPLSNCRHSDVTDVWVIQQFQPHSLTDHLANGRPWDLDRTHGGLQVLHPFQGTGEGGWHQGNADAIHRHAGFIGEFDPDLLLVLSADHIYKLDYRKVIETHLEREAEVTMVTTRVPLEEAARFGVLDTEEKAIRGYEYKPERPSSDVVATEVFVFDARVLMEELERFAGGNGAGAGEEGESGLRDLGEEVLPALVRRGRAFAYALEGYWRDVGTVESYWQGHMDLLDEEPPLVLDDPEWPILTLGGQRPPALITDTARVETSLISPGCRVSGRVTRSVLGPGVEVRNGAEVRDSIVLQDSVVGSGASVRLSIVDADVVIGEGASVGAGPDATVPDRGDIDREIAMVGHRRIVPAGGRIPPGARIQPGDDDPAP